MHSTLLHPTPFVPVSPDHVIHTASLTLRASASASAPGSASVSPVADGSPVTLSTLGSSCATFHRGGSVLRPVPTVTRPSSATPHFASFSPANSLPATPFYARESSVARLSFPPTFDRKSLEDNEEEQESSDVPSRHAKQPIPLPQPKQEEEEEFSDEDGEQDDEDDDDVVGSSSHSKSGPSTSARMSNSSQSASAAAAAGRRHAVAWTEEEDALLRSLVEANPGQKWRWIADHLPGRTGKQVRQRYTEQLESRINHEPLSPQESLMIALKHEELGNKWADIARMLDGRTANTVKNHWHSSLSKIVSSLHEQHLAPTAWTANHFEHVYRKRTVQKRRSKSRQPSPAASSAGTTEVNNEKRETGKENEKEQEKKSEQKERVVVAEPVDNLSAHEHELHAAEERSVHKDKDQEMKTPVPLPAFATLKRDRSQLSLSEVDLSMDWSSHASSAFRPILPLKRSRILSFTGPSANPSPSDEEESSHTHLHAQPQVRLSLFSESPDHVSLMSSLGSSCSSHGSSFSPYHAEKRNLIVAARRM